MWRSGWGVLSEFWKGRGDKLKFASGVNVFKM